MGMSRSGRNRLTSRPAECLSADHRLEKRSVSCRCTGSPQIFLQRRATCVRCRTSVEAANDARLMGNLVHGCCTVVCTVGTGSAMTRKLGTIMTVTYKLNSGEL